MTSLASTKSDDKKRECSERKLLWCSPQGISSRRGNVIKTQTSRTKHTQIQYHLSRIQHITHCTNMIKCFWQRNSKRNVKPSVLHRAHHHTITNCLGANHVFAKEQDKGKVKLIPQNSTHCRFRTLCARAGRPSCFPLVALVVGRGKINQEINYYNAKIGSVAPNIENKIKMIFL